MKLKILLPYKIFAHIENVSSMVAKTSEGFFGILPQRQDCVAALVPGIFSYKADTEHEKYIAVDAGILVKTGNDVVLSIRNASGGSDLGALHSLIVKDFQHVADSEKSIRTVAAKLEAGFMHHLENFRSH